MNCRLSPFPKSLVFYVEGRGMELELLIERAKSGSVEAYTELVERFQEYVYSICLTQVRRRELAMEAAQEVFLKAFRALPALRDGASFRSWLKRLAINHCVDEIRRNRPHLVSSLEEMTDVGLARAMQMGNDEISMEDEISIYSSLIHVPPEDRRILTWHHLYGVKVDSIADALGISLGNAKKRLERARSRLRKEMEHMEHNLDRGERLSAKIADLISRPDLVNMPGHPIEKVWADIRQFFGGFTVIDGDEVIDNDKARRFFSKTHQSNVVYDETRSLRDQTTWTVLDYIKNHSGEPCRIITAGRVWRDVIEDESHLQMFHQLDILEMGPSAHEGDVITMGTDLIRHLLPNHKIRWELFDYSLVNRCWELGVDNGTRYEDIGAGGEFKPEILRQCGVDVSRFKAIGIGFGLERLAMIRYGIRDITAVQRSR